MFCWERYLCKVLSELDLRREIEPFAKSILELMVEKSPNDKGKRIEIVMIKKNTAKDFFIIIALLRAKEEWGGLFSL